MEYYDVTVKRDTFIKKYKTIAACIARREFSGVDSIGQHVPDVPTRPTRICKEITRVESEL